MTDSFIDEQSLTASDDRDSSSCCGRPVRDVLRALTSEMIAVFVCTLLFLHVETELAERHVTSLERAALQAIVDAAATLAFVAAFKTIHLSPAVSLAQLLSVTTSWFLCIVFCTLQLVAATGAVFVHWVVKRPTSHSIRVQKDITMEWTKAAYLLIFSQFLGTLLVVLCFLVAVRPRDLGRGVRLGTIRRGQLGIFAATLVAAFLSLLKSTLSWNPVLAAAIATFNFVAHDSPAYWTHHYVYWLGPVLGSLAASFFYRLLLIRRPPTDRSATNNHAARRARAQDEGGFVGAY